MEQHLTGVGVIVADVAEVPASRRGAESRGPLPEAAVGVMPWWGSCHAGPSGQPLRFVVHP